MSSREASLLILLSHLPGLTLQELVYVRFFSLKIILFWKNELFANNPSR